MYDDVLKSLERWMESPVGIAWECYALSEDDARAIVEMLCERGVEARWYRPKYRCWCCKHDGDLVEGYHKVHVPADSFVCEIRYGKPVLRWPTEMVC